MTAHNRQGKPQKRTIPGTYVFDGDDAVKGYAVNAMCYSFNKADNRNAFAADEEAYMEKFKLPAKHRELVRSRDVIGLLDAGANIYYLAKLAGILGLGVQDVGALQTGMSVEEFKQKLLDQA